MDGGWCWGICVDALRTETEICFCLRAMQPSPEVSVWSLTWRMGQGADMHLTARHPGTPPTPLSRMKCMSGKRSRLHVATVVVGSI